MKILFTCIILLVLMTVSNVSSTSEGSFSCCQTTYSMFYDSAIDKLLVSCMGWPGSVNVVDPYYCTIDKQISITGDPDATYSVAQGCQLLVLTSELDQNPETEESQLTLFDISTSQIVDQELISGWSTDMVIDSSQTYAYVYVGLNPDIYGSECWLKKFRISDLTCVLESDIHIECEDLEITPNGEKLYAQDGSKIIVFDTADLSIINDDDLYVVYCDFNLKMGYDNRLYVSIGGPYLYNHAHTFYVIDTDTDQIIESLDFERNGVDFTDINPVTHKLYGLVYTQTSHILELDQYWYEPTNRIIEIDLDDYSFEYFILNENQYWEIAVAYQNNMNRIFCRVVESDTIRYIDR